MLKSLSFSNFYSFAAASELSFEVDRKPARSGYDLTLDDGSRLNKVLAVVGANGSGKTQLLKPLAFLSWFLTESFLHAAPKDKLPFKAHALHADEASQFELNFMLGGEHYRYRLQANEQRVLHESLYRKTTRLFSYVFVRDYTGTGYVVRQKGFGFPRALAEGIRGNASLLAAAHVHDVPAAAPLVEYFQRYAYNLAVTGRNHFDHGQVLGSAAFFQEHPPLQEQASQLLCALDLGLAGVELAELEAAASEDVELPHTLIVPMGVHQSGQRVFRLPFWDESSGTQAAYVLLRRLLPVLDQGGVAVIDEMDSDLHPHMLERFLDLFRFEHSNPHGAQLIFSCHTPEVLNLLAKHQVYVVEKQALESEAWRLDSVAGLRSDDNLYAKYQAGALGGVPDI